MFLGGVGIGRCIYLRPRRGGSPRGWWSRPVLLCLAASSRELTVRIRSHDGGIPTTGALQKSLALARVCNREKCTFRPARNSRSNLCAKDRWQKPWINYTKKGGVHAISRSWASLFSAGSFAPTRRGLFDSRLLVESIRFCFLLFIAFFYCHWGGGTGNGKCSFTSKIVMLNFPSLLHCINTCNSDVHVE